MSLTLVSPDEALPRLAQYASVIDARSEDEFALDSLPGAINWPSLNNEERRVVGTLYKQVSPFEARKHGAALVAANIARHIQREVLDKPRDWQPLVYCWRGGQRSHSLALVLGQIGFRVQLLEGGYKAFRAAVLADLQRMAPQMRYQVICGPTGSGKTRLLEALARAGAQVLDLEALACHRSSVLGRLPGVAQPTQKHFDTLIWQTLRQFDPAHPVFIEAESKKVGDVAVPESLITAMRASPCLDLDLSEDERVALLLEDYAWFSREPELLCQRLDVLVELRGKSVVANWKALVREGHIPAVVRDLLKSHYDPGYAASVQRNFSQYSTNKKIAVKDRHIRTFDLLAQKIIESTP